MAKWQVTTTDGGMVVVEAEEVMYDEIVVVLVAVGSDDAEALFPLARVMSVIKLADDEVSSDEPTFGAEIGSALSRLVPRDS